jgi:hypothetical protein
LLSLWAAAGVVTAHATPLGSSVRSGPATYLPGQTVTLTNQLAPLAQVSLYTLTETVPTGWTVGTITEGGSYDAAKHWVRWLFMDNQVRVVTYQLTAPANVSGPVFLSGTASFDGEAVPITGLSVLPLELPPSGALVRTLPASYRAGATVNVRLRATPDEAVLLYGVEEAIPTGWTVLSLGGGSLTAPGLIKWGPFAEAGPQDIAYTLVAPATASSNVAFRGTGWFDSTTVITSGDATMAPAPPGGGSVARTLPAWYGSGQSVTVTISIQPDLGTEVYAVLETPPEGWLATNLSDYGSVSADGRSVRWGPFMDADARTNLTYELLAPATARSNVVFSGAGEFDGVSRSTVGQVSLPWFALESGTVTRLLPVTCQPGRTISITNLVAPNEAVTTYALEEWVPSGWTVTNVGGGTYQAASHSVRWGPSFDNSTNVIVWQVTAPTNAVGSVTFTGTVWFGAAVLPIGGASNLTVLPPSQGTVLRSLPGFFQPGVAFTVTNALGPEAGVGFCVVEETVPEGWAVTNVSHYGFLVPGTRRLRWGPFTDDTGQTLTYTLLPPAAARGSVTFGGLAYFGEWQTTILGPTQLAANSPPTLSAIPNQTTGANRPLTLTFALTDEETPADQLQVSVLSSNESLLPSQNLALGWIGTTRRLTISPQPDQEGQTTITLTASDGTFTRLLSFVLTLRAPPRLTEAPTNQLVQLGATVHFTAAAAGSAPLSYQWQRDSVDVAGSVEPTLILPTVPTNLAGLYRIIVANDVGAVTSVVARLTVNSPPTPAQFALSTYLNTAQTFSASKLARAAHDPDGDPILLASVSVSSTNHGTVGWSAGQTTYTPPAGYTGADAFTYTLQDDRGGSATGTVTVTVESRGAISLNVNFGPVLTNGNFLIRFAGLPGATYTIEYTDSIWPANWQKATNLVAPATTGSYGRGVFQFSESAAGIVSRYYRTVYPSY